MGKVANHLKNLAMSAGSNFLGNALNLGFSAKSKAQAKVAAQLLKKSPFEPKDPPMDVMRRDPLQFSAIKYPSDLTDKELGHYIIFYSIFNRFSSGVSKDFNVAADMGWNTATSSGPAGVKSQSISDLRQLTDSKTGARVKPVKTTNSVLSKVPQNSQVTSAVALYMPPNVKVSYGANWDKSATELSGTIATALGKATTAETTADQIRAVTAGAIGGLGTWGKQLIGEMTDALNMGDPVKLSSKYFGVAINPHEEMFYEGPEFRSFDYEFDFYPRSRREMEDVNKIIFLFKYHMHPDLDQNITGGRLFYTPSEYEIHYAYMDRTNDYLNKISRCALEKMDVQYGNEGTFSSFHPDPKGASPVHTKMSLTFKELEFMTKDKIMAGF